jgi:hypothetical protein
MEFGAARFLDAVIGPQHLRTVGKANYIERLFVRVCRGKRVMPARVPVLCHNDMRKALGEPVDDRHHLPTMWDLERAAGAKIILDVDHQKDIAVADRQICGHDRLLSLRVSANALPQTGQ